MKPSEDWLGPKSVSVLTYLLAKGYTTSASLRAGTGVSRRHVANVLTPYIDQGHVVAKKGRGASFCVTETGRLVLEEDLRKARGLRVRASVQAERQTEVLQLLVHGLATTCVIASQTGRTTTSDGARLHHLCRTGHVTRHGAYWRLTALGRSRIGVEPAEQKTGPWTRAEEATLVRLRSRGLAYVEVAEDMGRSVAACQQRASRLRSARQVVRPRPRSSCVTDLRAEKMYMALEVGVPIEQAAREAGYSCPDKAMTAAIEYGKRLRTDGAYRLWRYDLGMYGEPATAMERAA